jgi:hypothetical protein
MPAGAHRAATERIGRLAQLFGFVQFEFAGALAVPDGRYLARDRDDETRESVLVTEATAATPRAGRRRRRARSAQPDSDSPALPLTRVTAVRAFQPFENETQASSWLEDAMAVEDALESVVAEALGLLNRALHAAAVASANPRWQEMTAEQAVVVRIGYGSGEEVAAGRFASAHEVELREAGDSRRRRRDAELHSQQRVAALLGGREQPELCETMLLRARADLDAGRLREAALQLRAGLQALLLEMPGVLSEPGHEEDLAQLQARRTAIEQAAQAALKGSLDPGCEPDLRAVLEICQRVLRRRRILAI